jgi:uncharacterized protein YbbC (DUF1343 family)
VVTFIWNSFAFSVLCAPQYGDRAIDGDASLFNYCIVIMAGITVIALEEWWRKSRNDWFGNLKEVNDSSDITDVSSAENEVASA